MLKEEMIVLTRSIAKVHGIDPALVCAVCHHESGNWNMWAVRYEPAFYSRYILGMQNVAETEKTGRAFSYGLMQIMGQTAREFGFKGTYLTELCDPGVGVEYGCRKLAKCLLRASNDVHKALLMYNGGGNEKYPELVLQYIERYA